MVTMHSLLVLAVLAAAPAAPQDQPKKDDAPMKKELFAKEDFYKGEKAKEEDFVGVLDKVKGGGGIGFGRFNPYRLTMTVDGKKMVREVYVGGKADLLDDFVGKNVKITGKKWDMEVEGKEHHEIWPARIEVVPAENREDKNEDKPAGAKEVKIFGQGFWRAGVQGGQQQQLVVRSAEELVAASGQPDKAKDEATQKMVAEMVCKALKVETIDWKTQMLVVASGGVQRSGGYSVEILSADAKDKVLTVRWKLNTPKPGQPVTLALTHPAAAALVEKFDGEVKFDPPAVKDKDK